MGKTLLAALAFAVAGFLGLSNTSSAFAAPAAHLAKVPAIQTNAHKNTTNVAWRLSRKWHNGCQRWRWAKHRKWICGPYGKCRWKYSGYYWGACFKAPAPVYRPRPRPLPRPRPRPFY